MPLDDDGWEPMDTVTEGLEGDFWLGFIGALLIILWIVYAVTLTVRAA